MKKPFFLFALAVILGFAPHVLAQGFTALAPIPGLTDISPTSVINSDTLASFFNNLYKYLIGLAAVLAVIQIIWAGIDISLHQDSVAATISNKGKIYNAIYGIILVLSPYLIFSIINPSILNLSLSLDAIDLNVKPAAPAQTNTTEPSTVPLPGGGTGYSQTVQVPVGNFCYPVLKKASVGGNYDPRSQKQCYPTMDACINQLKADKATPPANYVLSSDPFCIEVTSN